MLADVKGKKITVVGLARSGVGAANLLADLGAVVTVTDKKGPRELGMFLERLNAQITVVLGHHPPELFNQAHLIVVSPGVPLEAAPLKMASDGGIKIIGELELAYQIARTTKKFKKTGFLAVTGTNGKSTTTMLLYEMLRNAKLTPLLGGNIGTALTEELSKSGLGMLDSGVNDDIDYIVTEVSSFQLESIDEFRPRVAAILNITPDHLDRYSSMDDYIDAKCKLFLNQTVDDFLILNADDPLTREIHRRMVRRRRMNPELFYFSRKRKVKGAYLKNGCIHVSIPPIKGKRLPLSFLINPSSFPIKGVHNIENAMAASLMALLSDCSAEAVTVTLKSFPGLEHRLEFVRDIGGVRFINDSKGTNVGAVIKSLESFEEPILLIAGGRDKHGDFSLLRPLIKDKVKALILIGEARSAINAAVGDIVQISMEDTLKAAVNRAKQIALPGDVVLLSPACASFDMFEDFEDRGNQFKEIVKEL